MRQIAIIGGGAAGLCCACETAFLARQQGKALRITLFEANDRVGKKLLVTGNGRCNLTNLTATAADYNEQARAFLAPTFDAFPPQSTRDFFARLGLFTRADAVGRVYPLSNQAAGVLDALRLEARRLGVRCVCGHAVQMIRRQGKGFLVDGAAFDAVVLACGGKAAVKQFSGFSLLQSLGIPVAADAPSLVKLTTSSPLPKQLKGVRAGVRLTLLLNGNSVKQETGELQFADGVLSGICAMNLSPNVNRFFAAGGRDAVVAVDFVPSMDKETLRSTLDGLCCTGQRDVCEHLLSGLLPKQVGLALLRTVGLSPSCATGSLSKRELALLTDACKALQFPVTGTKDYADAQVMLGGAALDAFSPQTLEAKRVPHLYCCGELLDVDGPCGGYNLQWAFASARMCAKSMVEQS